MSDGTERREARRFTMSLPMRVLPREAKGHELDAHTRDVSYRGLYFLTEANFEVGSEIEFVITTPTASQSAGRCKYPLPGRGCAHRAHRERQGGHCRKIARYEFMPATATCCVGLFLFSPSPFWVIPPRVDN